MHFPFFFSSKERRRTERHRCKKDVSLTILVRPKLQKYKVKVYEVSQGGIGFLMETPLELNTVVALQRIMYSPRVSWLRSGKVIHATQQGERWLIGCELSPPFTEAEIASLTS
jgi:hypothetical protein